MNDSQLNILDQAGDCLFGPDHEYEKAFQLLSQIEDLPEARYLLSEMYLEGFHVPKDKEKGIQLLRQSAESGFLTAQEFLGTQDGGLESKLDLPDEECVKWLELACRNGSRKSTYELGWRYFSGQGVKEDEQKGLQLIRQSADKGYQPAIDFLDNIQERRLSKMSIESLTKLAEGGDANAQCQLGYKYYFQGDIDKSNHWFRISAENGFPESMHQLAVAYRRGQGVPMDYDKYRELEVKAAEGGYVPAMAVLADGYLRGYALPRSPEDYFKYTKMAAEHGSVWCMVRLAELYIHGNIVEKSFPDAFKWYSAAADKGDPEAIHNLAQMYYFGEGMPIDYKKAFELYSINADNEFDRSQAELAFMYANGYGTEKDMATAIRWYRRAAGHGNVIALLTLGIRYLYGEDVPQDRERGIRYLTKSAENGNTAAQTELAKAYLQGKVVERDEAKAKHWLEIASKGGSSEAKAVLDSLSDDPEPTIFELVDKAHRGDVEAMYEAGERFLKGIEVEECPSTALYYLIMASDRGHTDAMILLAEVYFRGWRGIRIDYNLAFRLYENVFRSYNPVQNNMSKGQFGYVILQLATMYTYGLGTSVSYDKAHDLITKMIDQGMPEGYRMRGEAHLYGRGVEKSKEKALEDLMKAMEMGEYHSPMIIGDILSSDGCFKEAMASYEIAAEMNNPVALCRIGELYENGQGVQQDYITAKNNYEAAINSRGGCPEASYRLGMMFYEGRGVPRSYETAISEFHRAVQGRYPDAMYMFALMLHKGEGSETNDKKAKEILEYLLRMDIAPELRKKAQELFMELEKK